MSKITKLLKGTFVAFLLALAMAGCGPRENAGPAAPSAAITKTLSETLARNTATIIGGTVFTLTPTGSMLPLVDSRSTVVVESIMPDERIYVGDIVIVKINNNNICHRVVEVDKNGLVATKGTGNMNVDPGWHRPIYRVVAIFYSMR